MAELSGPDSTGLCPDLVPKVTSTHRFEIVFKGLLWRRYPEEIWEGSIQGLRSLYVLDARKHLYAVNAGSALSRLQRLAVETGRKDQYRSFVATVLRDYPDCFHHLGLVQWELAQAHPPPLASTAGLVQQHRATALEWRDDTHNSSYTLKPEEDIEIVPGPEVGLGWLNCAPCLLTQASGDFVIETRITPEAHPRHAGGIVVWQDHSRLIRFASGITHQGEVSLGWHDGSQFRFAGLAYLRHQGLHLKLTRRGVHYQAFFSPDGATWYTCGHLDFGHDGPVEVGLFAECNYEYGFPQPFPIRFADFSLHSAPATNSAAPKPLPSRLYTLPEPAQFCGMVGQGRVFRTLCDKLQRAARSSLPLLITGETGTGKELAVRALHQLSANGAGPLVPVNLAALPADLIESELFGYTRGAFTGATADRAGLFEVAAGGTLFLDEIGELPFSAQAKLLRVLDSGEIRPLGSASARQVSLRCVAATNRDLSAAVAQGQFREDLFYRLGQPLQVPPLSARHDDIPHLVAHFLALYGNGHLPAITQSAMQRLMDHAWPDNIRGLGQVIEKALLATEEGLIEDHHLSLRPSVPLRPTVSRYQKPTSGAELKHLLRACDFDVAELSRRCGVNRKTVYRWFAKYGIEIANLRHTALS